ncbi:transcriptional regulator [Halobacteriales archaeon QS_1_68_20]|nr:MAG: transcriptional regulator [Halobacteriales archaeon QS_1_68_20]
MSARLPTGIDILDRKLEGGIPAGSIVALTAEPASQAELLLYELTAARGTLYLSTGRSDQAVQDGLERTPTRTGSPTVRHIGDDGEPLDQANQLIRALPESANLIIDTADPLERREAVRYRNFLNELQTQMVNTEGLAFLHCLDGVAPPDNRDITHYMADVVFELETILNGEQIENRLVVPKFRGGKALTEAIKLEMTEQVSVDTSRDIA